MEKLHGLDVVVDDDLHDRAVAEGMGLEDEADLFCWLAEQARDSGRWPRCGCARQGACCLDHRVVRSSAGGLALQEIDHRTGQPRDPERRRLEREARAWGHRHNQAQAWL